MANEWYKNPVGIVEHMTGRYPGPFPQGIAGPWLSAGMKTLVGAGTGYLLSKPLAHFFPQFDESRLGLVSALLGAGAGAGWGALDIHATGLGNARQAFADKYRADPGALHKMYVGAQTENTLHPPTGQPMTQEQLNQTYPNSMQLQKHLEETGGHSYDDLQNWMKLPPKLDGEKQSSEFLGQQSLLPAAMVWGARIDPGVAAGTLITDPILNPAEKATAFRTLAGAMQSRNDQGLITTGDLVRGAMGAGLGYAAGSLVGRTMGAVFGAPPELQQTLGRIGLVGGLLRASGIWRG